ncbi:hypothetical protein PMSD_13025 [Paenibacillus macquariensis subsp. defensor]|nr:hypothetical protein PMSD_13025 [Paenibacillus macquariensis subsp. defensor]
MVLSIDQQTAATFYKFGEDTLLEAGGQFHHQQEISIGSGVTILAHYWLNIIISGSGHLPKIIIGDGCKCDHGFIVSALNRIELERNVSIGPHMYISDTDHEYQNVGKPVTAQWLSNTSGEVVYRAINPSCVILLERV